MTNEEAIKTAMLIANGSLIDYKEILQNTKSTDAYNRLIDIIQAYEVTFQALEKQIPTSPIQEEPTNEARDDSEAYCPTCECYLEEDYRICPECGQKLDWSDPE